MVTFSNNVKQGCGVDKSRGLLRGLLHVNLRKCQ